jgi:hypothetical protein
VRRRTCVELRHLRRAGTRSLATARVRRPLRLPAGVGRTASSSLFWGRSDRRAEQFQGPGGGVLHVTGLQPRSVPDDLGDLPLVATGTLSTDGWAWGRVAPWMHSSGWTGITDPLARRSAMAAASQRSSGSGPAVVPRAGQGGVLGSHGSRAARQDWMTQTPVGPITRWSKLADHPGRVTSCTTRWPSRSSGRSASAVRRCVAACRRQTLALAEGRKRTRQPVTSAAARAMGHAS